MEKVVIAGSYILPAIRYFHLSQRTKKISLDQVLYLQAPGSSSWAAPGASCRQHTTQTQLQHIRIYIKINAEKLGRVWTTLLYAAPKISQVRHESDKRTLLVLYCSSKVWTINNMEALGLFFLFIFKVRSLLGGTSLRSVLLSHFFAAGALLQQLPAMTPPDLEKP